MYVLGKVPKVWRLSYGSLEKCWRAYLLTTECTCLASLAIAMGVDLATSATVALGWAGIPILPLPLPLPDSLPSILPSWHWQHSRNLHFGDFDFVA